MKAFEWHAGVEMGLPVIDAQHRELLTVANQLLAAVQMPGASYLPVVKAAMTKLRTLWASHFIDEEKYMQQLGFSELTKHQEEHRRMVKRVKNFQEDFYRSRAVGPAEVKAFLKEWLIGHFLSWDIRFATYAKERQAAEATAATPSEAAAAGGSDA